MAVGNSLAKRNQNQQASGLTAYLAKDAVRNQINSVVGGKNGPRFISSTGESGAAGMHELQYRISCAPGRVTESFPEPAAWSVLYGTV